MTPPMTTDTPDTTAPGRTCPLSYRYNAQVFNRPEDLQAETLYVVGGLYGNPEALDAVEALFATEPGAKRMVFNGDFHWFDTDTALFASVNDRVHRHLALRGNVETELASDHDDVGCGCAYPDHVDDADVARSNTILAQLRDTARRFPGPRAQLATLPMHAVARVGGDGGVRVGIVHGDAESLAGWRFDPALLQDPANAAWLDQVFNAAQVDVFASSHTCAPALHAAGPERLVVNNGSAGLASLAGHTHGIVTRISVHPAPSAVHVLQQQRVRGVWVQALRLDFDDARWQRRFLAMWPEGSPAHTSYWRRIVHGPSSSPACRA